MASTVTYMGPEDPTLANSVAYQIDDGNKDITFRLGVEVEGVSDALVKRLKADKAHKFDVTTKTQGGAS